MPRYMVRLDTARPAAADGDQQDIRFAAYVGNARDGVAYFYLTENTSTAAMTFEVLTHVDRDQPPTAWLRAGDTTGVAGSSALVTVAVPFSEPADWLIWKVSGGTAGKVIRFSVVLYLNEP